ncbi:helix-turn-helix transcriptional regulator [Burkholderia cepacia]|uniref:helix-turn-helix transcriptional regulator n=1 Tax=Burkholderia cepacia TaxID=292 RepID=UPI002AB73E0D|nr:AlpA family phage regulatory protein [Burkholderia cepacia]
MPAKFRNAPSADGVQSEPTVLPIDGFVRWADLKQFVPFSHETLRQREMKGLFPRRVQLGSARCVAWPNREIHRWLADPAGYRAPEPA